MNWLNAAILFIFFAGHCELMAAWINRVHALPYRRSILGATRLLHDFLLLAYWPIVLWRVGFGGPRLLVDGEWTALPLGWKAYFALCGLGVLSLVVAIVRESLRKAPEIRDSRLINVPNETGKPCIGPGWRGRLAQFPGNEALLLEVNEKEFVVPSLPVELDGLSIAHFSDIHFRGPIGLDYFRYSFDRIAEMNADLIAFSGDLLDEQDRLEWLPETFGRLSAPLGCWYILGNHDALLDPEPMREALRKWGWKNLGGRAEAVECNNRRIALGGDERPWLGSVPDFSLVAPTDLRILLSHTPDNIRDAASKYVDLMLSGHNHGGQIRLPLIGPVYSPSRCGVRYAAGAFRVGPTLLHVSRGLSAERPLRWNCPPEITKIVLRSGQPD